jgi:hypothetical protein
MCTLLGQNVVGSDMIDCMTISVDSSIVIDDMGRQNGRV